MQAYTPSQPQSSYRDVYRYLLLASLKKFAIIRTRTMDFRLRFDGFILRTITGNIIFLCRYSYWRHLKEHYMWIM